MIVAKCLDNYTVQLSYSVVYGCIQNRKVTRLWFFGFTGSYLKVHGVQAERDPYY